MLLQVLLPPLLHLSHALAPQGHLLSVLEAHGVAPRRVTTTTTAGTAAARAPGSRGGNRGAAVQSPIAPLPLVRGTIQPVCHGAAVAVHLPVHPVPFNDSVSVCEFASPVLLAVGPLASVARAVGLHEGTVSMEAPVSPLANVVLEERGVCVNGKKERERGEGHKHAHTHTLTLTHTTSTHRRARAHFFVLTNLW